MILSTETLLIGGTDVLSVPGLVLTDTTALLADGQWRGDNIVIPGMPGEVGTVHVRDAYDMPVSFVLGCEDGSGNQASTALGMRVQFLSNLAALQGLVTTNLVTLTRRLSKATTPFYVATTCAGDVRSISLATVEGQDSEPDPFSVAGVLNLRNLSGGWS